MTTPFQHLWVSKLMGYTFEIHYKQGKENVAADTLSRVSGAEFLKITLSQAHDGFYDSIKQLWETDPNLQRIISEIKERKSSHPSFTFINNELRRKGKLVVGNDEGVKMHILRWLHDSAVGGHSGKDATLQRIRSLFYWPRMYVEVQNYIRNC